MRRTTPGAPLLRTSSPIRASSPDFDSKANFQGTIMRDELIATENGEWSEEWFIVFGLGPEQDVKLLPCWYAGVVLSKYVKLLPCWLQAWS